MMKQVPLIVILTMLCPISLPGKRKLFFVGDSKPGRLSPESITHSHPEDPAMPNMTREASSVRKDLDSRNQFVNAHKPKADRQLAQWKRARALASNRIFQNKLLLVSGVISGFIAVYVALINDKESPAAQQHLAPPPH